MSKTFEQLPAAETPTGTETVPINQSSATRRTTINAIKDFIGVGYDLIGTAAAAIVTHLAAYAHGNISHSNRSALDAVVGVNTGDQDLSGLALRANTVLTSGVTLGNSNQTGATVLDWYEEGTWTPVGVLEPTLISADHCTFTRIGNMVFLLGGIVVADNGSNNVVTISGLPYAAATGSLPIGNLIYPSGLTDAKGYCSISSGSIHLYDTSGNALLYSTLALTVSPLVISYQV